MGKPKMFRINNELTQGMEETVNVAQNYAGELGIEVISLKRIELDPENPRELSINLEDLFTDIKVSDPLAERKRQERESLESLASSIEKEGLLNPILVYKFGEKYRLIAGERRSLASVIAGKEYIEARVISRPDKLKLSMLQWIENIEREDLTLWERLRNLEKLISGYQANEKGIKVTPSVLSQLIGCSIPHAMNYCTVLGADDSLKKLIFENKIKNLEKAALICKISEPELKQQTIEACIEGSTIAQLKALSNSNLNAQKNKKIIDSSIQNVGRGRQYTKINLGATTNVNAIKYIIDSALNNEKYKSVKTSLANIDWRDYGALTKAFKHVLTVIEENE